MVQPWKLFQHSPKIKVLNCEQEQIVLFKHIYSSVFLEVRALATSHFFSNHGSSLVVDRVSDFTLNTIYLLINQCLQRFVNIINVYEVLILTMTLNWYNDREASTVVQCINFLLGIVLKNFLWQLLRLYLIPFSLVLKWRHHRRPWALPFRWSSGGQSLLLLGSIFYQLILQKFANTFSI